MYSTRMLKTLLKHYFFGSIFKVLSAYDVDKKESCSVTYLLSGMFAEKWAVVSHVDIVGSVSDG